MNKEKDRLYNLLPSVYRRKDAKEGFPLKAFFSVLSDEMELVEADIENLYNNMFVETCDEWALPYIGGLLGITDLIDEKNMITSQRRRIANAMKYRRSKGVAAILENVARDVTGWEARAVEYFGFVSMTETVMNPSGEKGRILDLRNRCAMEQLYTPFSFMSHMADMRRIGAKKRGKRKRSGKIDTKNIGLFLWRIRSYASGDCEACKKGDGLFTFDAAGLDRKLFNKPLAESDLTTISAPENLPIPMGRNLLSRSLEDYKNENAITAAEHRPENGRFYGSERGLNIKMSGSLISPMHIISADLSEWKKPASFKFQKHVLKGLKSYMDEFSLIPLKELSGKSFYNEEEFIAAVKKRINIDENIEKVISDLARIDAAIDVELGRIAFPETREFSEEEKVLVNYHYGFAGDIGGGTYDRTFDISGADECDKVFKVSGSGKAGHFSSLDDAVKEWSIFFSDRNAAKACIKILDNRVYGLKEPVNIPDGAKLSIEAGDGLRPIISLSQNELIINGPEKGSAEIYINGIWINKPLKLNGALNLDIRHSTIMSSGQERLLSGIIEGENAKGLKIYIDKSIISQIRISGGKIISLTVENSIIDGGSGKNAISGNTPDEWGPFSIINRSTILGRVKLRELAASEVIFTEKIEVERIQTGYARFSYIPQNSRTPLIYRCQPNIAINDMLRETEKEDLSLDEKEKIEKEAYLRVQPVFASLNYGEADYARLKECTAQEILAGAEDGSEMGVFQHLNEPRREENLKNVINDYIQSGFAAGYFYAT